MTRAPFPPFPPFVAFPAAPKQTPSVFTDALLQGMNSATDVSADCRVTVKELDAYLNDKVPELTRKFRGTVPYPNSFTRGQDFPIAVTAGP